MAGRFVYLFAQINDARGAVPCHEACPTTLRLSFCVSLCLPFVCVSLSVIVIVVDVLCVCLCVCVNLMGIPQRKCSAQAQKDRKGQRQQECQGRRQERGAIGKGGGRGNAAGTCAG